MTCGLYDQALGQRMSEDKKLERFLITVTTNWCVTTIEDFDRDIKYYVDAVGLKLDNIERSYYLNQFGQIMCTPNGKGTSYL